MNHWSTSVNRRRGSPCRILPSNNILSIVLLPLILHHAIHRLVNHRVHRVVHFFLNQNLQVLAFQHQSIKLSYGRYSMASSNTPTETTTNHTQFYYSRSMFLSKLISIPCTITALTAVTLTTGTTKSCAIELPTKHMTQQSSQMVGKKQSKSSTDSTWEQTISGLVSGTVLTAAKTIVKYPMDTATVRLQMPNTPYSIYDPISLFRGSFQGITAQLLGTIPSGAVFFAVKDAVKAYIISNSDKTGDLYDGLNWDAIRSTCIAVAAAQPPYWLVRNPSEVIKTREQVGDMQDIQHMQGELRSEKIWNTTATFTWEGVQDLYRGYWENIIYAYPADVIKFVLYETMVSLSLQRQKQSYTGILGGGNQVIKVRPLEGAFYGAVSTAVSQCITTPLDVVRNRIMVDSSSSTNTTKQSSYVDTLIELAQNEGMAGLFAGVGPKVAKAFLSGAIQFAAYEETSQSIQDMFKR